MIKHKFSGDLEESLSTKSSSIELVSPVVSDVGNLKGEDSLATNSEAESVREAAFPISDRPKETSSDSKKDLSPAESPINPQVRFNQTSNKSFRAERVSRLSLARLEKSFPNPVSLFTFQTCLRIFTELWKVS